MSLSLQATFTQVVVTHVTSKSIINLQTRDERIVIFCRIPDSVNRRLISGRFRIRIRIFDVTLPLVYIYKNYSKSRPMLYFSVIFNRQSCQVIKSLTNPSNSHCSVLQPVQNLSKFSFRIKGFSALSVDRRLFLSVRMFPTALKTRSLGTVLIGCPIKRQHQPLAGRVIQVENTDRFLYAYFCEASSVNTACGNSVSCIKGIKHGHNRRAAGSGRVGNLIGGFS